MKTKTKIIITLIIIALGACAIYYLSRSSASTVPDVIDTGEVTEAAPDSVQTVNIANREMIQVRFSWESNGIKYNDALNIPKDEYQKLTDEDIERMKYERFENWARTVNEQSKK